MELSWDKRSSDTIALDGLFRGKVRTLGWIMPNAELGTHQWFKVSISALLSATYLPCEEVKYVTLREAMRALKGAATVLLIGRGYGT